MYRAETIDGQVVTGDHAKVEGKHYIIPEDVEIESHCHCGIPIGLAFIGIREVLPQTLARDTTAKDKNGTPIFGPVLINGEKSKGGDTIKCLMDYCFIQGKRVNRYKTVEVESGCRCHVFPSGILLIDGVHQAEVIPKEGEK